MEPSGSLIGLTDDELALVVDALLYRRCDLDNLLQLHEKVGHKAAAADLRRTVARLMAVAEKLGNTSESGRDRGDCEEDGRHR